MAKIVFVLLFTAALSSCQERKVNKDALAFAKRANAIYIKNSNNPDSLALALYLIDSCLKIQSDFLNFYFTKIEILRQLDRHDEMVGVYSKMLELSKNNSIVLMSKGAAFEHLQRLDSANYYYKLALDNLDRMTWQKRSFKEYQRIILYALLKDSINFRKGTQEFKKTFSGDNESKFMYQALVEFDRDEYVAGL